MSIYTVLDIDILDSSMFAEYQRGFPAILAKHGGRYLSRGGPIRSTGEWGALHRIVIFETPSWDALAALFSDPDYQPLIPIRDASARIRSIHTEGTQPEEPTVNLSIPASSSEAEEPDG